MAPQPPCHSTQAALHCDRVPCTRVTSHADMGKAEFQTTSLHLGAGRLSPDLRCELQLLQSLPRANEAAHIPRGKGFWGSGLQLGAGCWAGSRDEQWVGDKVKQDLQLWEAPRTSVKSSERKVQGTSRYSLLGPGGSFSVKWGCTACLAGCVRTEPAGAC